MRVGDFVKVRRHLPLAEEGKMDAERAPCYTNGPHRGRIIRIVNGQYVAKVREHELIVLPREIWRVSHGN